MPTYEYSCPKCGDFEVYQSIKDATLTVCPTCKSKKLVKRISSGAGVIFSGSGFWETDYNRSKDYSSKKKSETSAPASAPTPTTTPAATPAASPTAAPAKADSKPAKSESKPAKSESKPASPPPAK